MSRRRDESGSLSVEMVILTPVLVGCILTIAGGARLVEAEFQVSHAASVAARAASLESAVDSAVDAGTSAAARSLADRGQACTSLDVRIDASQFQPGGQLRATVTCHADLSDLVGFGLPGAKSVTATAVVPIESHRVL